MAAAPSCSPGLPSRGRWARLTPRGKGLGGDFPRFAQILGPKKSSLPPPAGRGAEEQLSPYRSLQPGAGARSPRGFWKLRLGHTLSLSTSLQVPCLLLKVDQPFLPLDEMRTEGPLLWAKAAHALRALWTPAQRPHHSSPELAGGPPWLRKTSPTLASLYPPEKPWWWAERDFSPSVRQESGRRAPRAHGWQLNCAPEESNPLGNSLQDSALFCQVTTPGICQAQSPWVWKLPAGTLAAVCG